MSIMPMSEISVYSVHVIFMSKITEVYNERDEQGTR